MEGREEKVGLVVDTNILISALLKQKETILIASGTLLEIDPLL